MLVLPGQERRRSARRNETKPLFCWSSILERAAAGELAGQPASYFLLMSPTQQNDRGFVALRDGDGRLGPVLLPICREMAGPRGPAIFAEYQVK